MALLLNIFRVVLSITKGFYVEGCSVDDLQRFEKSKSAKDSKHVSGVVAATLEETTAVQKRIEDLKKYGTQTLRHLDELQAPIVALASGGKNMHVESLMKQISFFATVDGKVAPSLVMEFRDALLPLVLREAAEESEKVLNGRESAAPDILANFAQQAQRLFGSNIILTMLLDRVRERERT